MKSATDWTHERIEKLTTADVQQLRENAERLSHPVIVERCNEVLQKRPRARAGRRRTS